MNELIQFNQLNYELKECFKHVFPSLKDDSKIHLEKKNDNYNLTYLKSNKKIKIINCDTLRYKLVFNDLIAYLLSLRIKRKIIEFIYLYYDSLVDDNIQIFSSKNKEQIKRCNRYLQKYRSNIIRYVIGQSDYYLVNDEKPVIYSYSEFVSYLSSMKDKSNYLLIGPFSLTYFASANDYKKKYCVLKRQHI